MGSLTVTAWWVDVIYEGLLGICGGLVICGGAAGGAVVGAARPEVGGVLARWPMVHLTESDHQTAQVAVPTGVTVHALTRTAK